MVKVVNLSDEETQLARDAFAEMASEVYQRAPAEEFDDREFTKTARVERRSAPLPAPAAKFS